MKAAPFTLPKELEAPIHLLSQAGALVQLYDGAGTRFVNERMLRALGYPAERYLDPAFFFSLVPREDRREVVARFNSRRHGDYADPSFDIRLIAASGARVEVSVSVSEVEAGGRQMFLAVGFDRTAAHVERNELLLYRSAFQAADRGFAVFAARTEDADSFEVAVTNDCLPAPMAPGSPLSALGQLEASVAPLLRRALQANQPQTSPDIAVNVESGERRIYRASAHAIDSQHVALVLDDVSFQRQVEREVVQAQKNEQLAMLSGTIAHDFSNLLTAVHTFAELGRETIRTDVESTEYFLSQIAETAMQASQLSRNLLRFSKRDSGTPRPISAGNEVRKFEPILRALARGRADLSIDVSRTNWAVFLDPVHLEQVVVNLVGNAVDAVSQSSGKVTVEVEDLVSHNISGEEGEYVRIRVCDNGSGIASDDIERVFEPYFSRKGERGTGLGLAICRKIVKQYLGDIRLQSEIGKGTTFAILLPRHEEAVTAGVLEEDLSRLAGTERILLVEDQDGLREVLVAFLNRLGYGATGVASAAEAMEIATAEGGAIDVLVADVELAESTGPELAARLKGQWPAVQVLFVSGSSHPGDLSMGQHGAAGAAFLPKPFTARQLAKQIRLLIDGHSYETT